jgi:hypothetical protein
VTVEDVEPETVRTAVVALAMAQGLRTCAEWGVSAAGSEVCLGGRFKDSAVTVASFRQPNAYLIKIRFYVSGAADSDDWSTFAEQYRAVIAAVSRSAQVRVDRSGELLVVKRV